MPGNVSSRWTWSDPEMWIDETATIFDSEWHVEAIDCDCVCHANIAVFNFALKVDTITNLHLKYT